jgi:acyl dehydratase
MTTEAVFEYDASVVGQQVEVGSAQITADHIATYCAALGETNPLYISGGFAPPGILHTLSLRGGPDAKVKFGNSAFHSGMGLQLFAPIKADDTITVLAEVKEVYAKTGRTGTMVFQVRRNHYRNQDGVEIAVADSSTVYRQVGQAQ